MRMPKLASARGQTLLTDNKPYLYRQAPIEAGMLDDELIGGTVAVNQIVQNGNFTDTSGWMLNTPGGTMTASSNTLKITITNNTLTTRPSIVRTSSVAPVANHVYIQTVRGKLTTSKTNSFPFGFFNGSYTLWGNAPKNQWFDMTVMMKYTSGNNGLILYSSNQCTAYNVGDTIEWQNFMTIDLTAMFCSTIADYAYTLEQGHAGDGIAWLKSFGFFTKDFYPYDAGSLLSVKTSAHETVGKNVSPLATIPLGTDTVTMTVNNPVSKEWCLSFDVSNINYQSASAAFISFTDMSNVTTYKTPYFVYTADGTPFGNITRPYTGRLYTTFTGTLKTISFMYRSDSWGIYSGGDLTNIQLEEGSTPTDYQAPFSHTYPLSDIELRGIPKLTDGNIVYDGDTYESDGTVTRKYGVRAYQAGDESDSTVITDMTNTVYPLVTPTSETTTPFDNPQLTGTTEEYIDTRTVPMPVGHVTEYFNMEQMEKIQMHMGRAQAIRMHMPKGD